MAQPQRARAHQIGPNALSTNLPKRKRSTLSLVRLSCRQDAMSFTMTHCRGVGFLPTGGLVSNLFPRPIVAALGSGMRRGGQTTGVEKVRGGA